jgi:hypothetical protein
MSSTKLALRFDVGRLRPKPVVLYSIQEVGAGPAHQDAMPLIWTCKANAAYLLPVSDYVASVVNAPEVDMFTALPAPCATHHGLTTLVVPTGTEEMVAQMLSPWDETHSRRLHSWQDCTLEQQAETLAYFAEYCAMDINLTLTGVPMRSSHGCMCQSGGTCRHTPMQLINEHDSCRNQLHCRCHSMFRRKPCQLYNCATNK